ncbi:hypothetical protein C483_03230 [Natrialba hulunbeirensis JCM 10989]|uniref:Uncharacterized protein n=1 Tax=Natrialba hulunbeirensis JCM 10989 TaxID=1227493 RepID=M0A6G3_9EURY|nr:DUF2267 domain-containing protein [Natrialba hulunbeirensis]ELY94144.1 hypothetical protein C483_03230 [Natrialba hulunbeirensis JCM 10989]
MGTSSSVRSNCLSVLAHDSAGTVRRHEPPAADALGRKRGLARWAAQLPEELGRFLEDVDDVERFEFEEFIGRVSERSEVGEDDQADAAFHAQLVMEVVTAAVEPGAINDVRDQVPTDEGYGNLFDLAEQEESPR